MDKDALLIELLGTSDLQLIAAFTQHEDTNLRAKAYWILATFSSAVSFEQIKQELLSSTNDLARIYLAAALFQLDSSYHSPEILFLSDYYLQHYYDQNTDELLVDLTDTLGRSAVILGLILWEAGHEIFSINDLKTYKVEWLLFKADQFS